MEKCDALKDVQCESKRRLALDWVRRLCEAQGWRPTPDEDAEIWLALQRLPSLPREQHSLGTLIQLLQNKRVKGAIQPYLYT